jgi:hypothetical protein
VCFDLKFSLVEFQNDLLEIVRLGASILDNAASMGLFFSTL